MSSRDHKTRAPETPDPSLEDWRPKAIGPFTILKVLGEGGMGTVYLAEQMQPIRRLIALKLVKLGHDTKEVLARFAQERQALSLMNHPNIAKVFDAGANEDGRPYFVMEFVDGVRISDYCDAQELSIIERLHLFLDVCAGIQHAHQKGIIHRDIKPSNILVTVENDQAIPKIIDFGLAQATEQSLTDQTLHTRQGQWIGTPEYMSPEQAGRGSDVLDTRADIYSLGVLLYEMLTGHLPFDSWLLREAGLAEIQRTIQEVEPPKPSTKVGTTTELDSDLAKRRATEPAILRKRLQGDLDWIVMRAIEKDPARRYASAGDFAADIRRHLEHKPALAGPPSWSYRFQKFLRRYRFQVGAAAAVAIALIVGLILAFQQYRRAEKNAEDALAQTKIAREQERKAAAAAIEAKASAEIATKNAEAAQKAQARLAQESERTRRALKRANETLERFELLSNVARFEALRKLSGSLWPAWPQNLPALNDWGTEFNRIYGQRQHMRRAIREIDARIADFDRTYDREWRELANKYKTFGSANMGREDLIALMRSSLVAIRQSQEQAMLETLEELRLDEFLRDTLEKLIVDVERERTGMRADVRRRILWARSIERRSIEEHADAWKRASRAVGINRVYRGFSLRPQIGLVPLGADPDSGLQEFVHLASHGRRAELPSRDAARQLELGEDDGIIFVLLPPVVGTDQRLLQPIFLAKHEMTQAQWLRLSGQNPSEHAPRASNPGSGAESTAPSLSHPVENVNHAEAMSILTRHGLRLPHDIEWEHAAHGSRSRPGPRGVRLDPKKANLSNQVRALDAWPVTSPVGAFEPNGYGLCDLYGNVAEWCATRKPDAKEASVRGGCWSDEPWQGPEDAARLEPRTRRSDRIGIRAARVMIR